MSNRVWLGVSFLWRERRDKFFKTRVAAQRVPEWEQFQLAIGNGTWRAGGNGQLLAGELFITNPGSDHRQILDHRWPSDGIFFHRQKLNRAAPFAQRFFLVPESGIDQTQHAPRRAEIRLG